MPFGLRNVGSTYQLALTAIFHVVLHDHLEDYVDDIVIKSQEVCKNVTDLRNVFIRCRQYKLRMNHLKFIFCIYFGKFLGFIVHRKEIDLDLAISNDIQYKEPLSTYKQLKSFVGRVSYIRKVIPILPELI